MTPLLLSISLGLSVYLLYEGLTNPQPWNPAARTRAAVRRYLDRAGLRDVGLGQFLLFSAAAGLLTGAAAQVLLGWGVISGLIAVAGLQAPLAYYGHRRAERQAAIQMAIPDAIAQLRDAIRTGLSVQEAVRGLAETGPEALRGEFAGLVRETQAFGFEEALLRMQDRLADPVFDVVAATLRLNEKYGGRKLSQVLDRLAHATRAEHSTQEEVRTYNQRNVLAARVVAAVPICLLILLRHVNPAFLAVYDGPGQIILVGAFASICVGYVGVLLITRLPGETRVLREGLRPAGLQPASAAETAGRLP